MLQSLFEYQMVNEPSSRCALQAFRRLLAKLTTRKSPVYQLMLSELTQE